jgi:MFS family permease
MTLSTRLLTGLENTFRSLATPNFRLWSGGALIANIGIWMQRTAQDWLVLTQLTHKNATAVGIVMALQFGPQLLLMPLAGFAADHFDRRLFLIVTQSIMGALALGLGVLTLAGLVQLWHVYLFAFLLGCVTAIDAPARQVFVVDLVGESDITNAVALTSTSFHAARMIGPAIAGLLIAAVGSGWVFIINACAYAVAFGTLMLLHVEDPRRRAGPLPMRGSFAEGLRYVEKRDDLKAALAMLFIVSTFGFNFPIFISTMCVTAFHAGADQFGYLSSLFAGGSVLGSLFVAGRVKHTVGFLGAGAAAFAAGCALAALMPRYGYFGVALALTGIAAQIFSTSTTSLVQLATEPIMRGRVMAILLAIAVGGTPIGAPIIGWVADHFGPRLALGVAVLAGLAAAAVALRYLAKSGALAPRPQD